MLITNKNYYNVKKPTKINKLLQKIHSSTRIHKVIPLNMLRGITVTRFGK